MSCCICLSRNSSNLGSNHKICQRRLASIRCSDDTHRKGTLILFANFLLALIIRTFQ
eukprot:Gb_08140 [translate_table: standard]